VLISRVRFCSAKNNIVCEGRRAAGWRQRIGERESGGGRLLRGQLGLFRVTHKLI